MQAKTLKERREEERKKCEAEGDTRAWSSFYMRPDTVAEAVAQRLLKQRSRAEAVAQRYGVAKRDLLDSSASDTAVWLALGEAHIVADTKRALLDAADIHVSLMEQFATAALQALHSAAAAKAAGKADVKADGGANGGDSGGSLARSKSVVLVKNLPFKVEAGELVGLFQRFGPVARFVLPPTNTVALVEMADSADAKRAFKGLAYKKYQHVPLYLEWAPKGILLEPATPSNAPTTTATATSREAGGGPGEGRAREENEGGEMKSVKKQGAVGLLPVVMDGKAARRVAAEAETVGGVAGRDGGGEGGEGHAVEGEEDGQPTSHSVFVKNLSFATTEAQLKEHLEKLLRSKHTGAKGGPSIRSVTGTVLDGHASLLQLSKGEAKGGEEKEDTAGAGGKGKESSTKVMLKSMRLARKFDRGHRRFAFVEFARKREAESAFDALKSTHLYGRHLVLERAKEGEGADELRAKTAAQFLDQALRLV
ncbi:unnamed protein product [Closterium sp. NIES-64]|nr:unnamed protein product [Closterium sp. NIES-64]